MIKEFSAFLTLFKQGQELTNSKRWKEGAVVANVAACLSALVVIAGGFGYELQIDDATIQKASAGIAALFFIGNAVLHIVTSKKVGLPDNAESDSQLVKSGAD